MELSFDRSQSKYVVVKKDILNNKSDFMYPTYCMLIDTVKSVINKANVVSENDMKSCYSEHYLNYCCDNKPENPIAPDLYRYSGNIIAISGKRGQGKTSAMLSLSYALAHGVLNRSLSSKESVDYSFCVLDPIDPTVLETEQSPLLLILSRIFSKTEDLIRRHTLRGSYRDRRDGVDDSEWNKLARQFQKCMAGIRAVKSFDKKDEMGLALLHSISDSSKLKCDFYELIDSILKIEVEYCGPKKSFLVIQLDDTDYQIARGYEFLEDIRKYLTLPNVLILIPNFLIHGHPGPFGPGFFRF